ncbi:rod shape-determining protein RodA [soil metagenome]
MQSITNYWNNLRNNPYEPVWSQLHIDLFLLFVLTILISMGLVILYSAANHDLDMLERQAIRIGMAAVAMVLIAQIPPAKLQMWAPWVFSFGVFLLLVVLVMGHIGKGAQRWLSLGLLKFQPSEIMKLALPLMLAWYYSEKHLPPNKSTLFIASLIIIIPAILTAKQPDLGTAVLISAAGACVLLLSGISWWLILTVITSAAASAPLLWHFLHDYQRQRVLTFLNPERDPLSTGYHIIQSKIAIGSGGIFGKGWLQGTQSHLQFLPEHATDFIFAVCGEEFGLVGGCALLLVYIMLIARGLYIAMQAQNTFSRLLAGSITLTLFISVYINIGMVTGILPVVGVPLPLISYGGTSIIMIMIGMGILMSIHTHRKLVSS